MNEKSPVTDHAIVRYLERVEGWDIEKLRREIEERTARAIRLGAPVVRLDGVKYVLCGNRVITVYRR